MNFDPITNAVAIAIRASQRRYEHVLISRTVTATGNGIAVFRCMGAGGGGGSSVGPSPISRGGNGGTVAIKTVSVAAGDQFVVTIPAGGAGSITSGVAGGAGGTLSIVRSGTTLLSIPGGNGGSGAGVAPSNNAPPTGADWYVLGGLGGNAPCSGGGGAMLVEGGTVAGRGGNSGPGTGGGGALGNGGDSPSSGGGGATMSSVSASGGGGFITDQTCVLRFAPPISAQAGMTSASVTGIISMGAYAGGNGEIFIGGLGGFGGGGGGSNHTSGSTTGGKGGFGGGGGGGGGGGNVSGFGGDGGFGGGGGGGSGSNNAQGGSGGQGWVTIEWQGGAA